MVYSSLVCDGEDFGTYGKGGGVREKIEQLTLTLYKVTLSVLYTEGIKFSNYL